MVAASSKRRRGRIGRRGDKMGLFGANGEPKLDNPSLDQPRPLVPIPSSGGVEIRYTRLLGTDEHVHAIGAA